MLLPNLRRNSNEVAKTIQTKCRTIIVVPSSGSVNQSSSLLGRKTLALFQPDILVTVQYLSTYRRRFHLQPEQLLMLAVLEDAVVCFQDNLTAATPHASGRCFARLKSGSSMMTNSTCSPLTISARSGSRSELCATRVDPVEGDGSERADRKQARQQLAS